ncbi:MAG: MFS transporter [Promethearchaeota archaeon]
MKNLDQASLAESLDYVIKDGIFSQLMISLTTGVFLLDFIISLGATNLIIGLFITIPIISQLLQIPATLIIERFRNRRKIVFFSAIGSRSAIVFFFITPFLQTNAISREMFLIIGWLIYSSFASITACSWSSWMHDLIPKKKLGDFFSRRMRYSTFAGMPGFFFGGFFIDFWKSTYPYKEYAGYSLIFGLGLVFGLISLLYIAKTKEPAMLKRDFNLYKLKLSEMFLNPLKDRNYLKLIIYMVIWTFASNLATPFFLVYLLRRLNFSLKLVTILILVSQVSNILSYRIWGRLSDKFSNKSVLLLSSSMSLIILFLWTFTTLPETHPLSVPIMFVIYFIMGVSLAGVSLASLNIGLKLAPKTDATAYLAGKNIFASISGSFAPIIGGLLADVFNSYEFSITFTFATSLKNFSFITFDLRQWDFFFIIALLIGLISFYPLSLVKESGYIKNRIFLKEFFNEIWRSIQGLSAATVIYYYRITQPSIFRVIDNQNTKDFLQNYD